jgi:trans-aconitate methyltransferase
VTFDGPLYAANTAHHRAHDAEVLAQVPLGPGVEVLDLGCGSGDFTASLLPRVEPGGRVVGVDASPSQIEHARSTHAATDGPAPTFVLGRAQEVGSLFPPGSFDVVVSVATLHWVPAEDQPGVLDGLGSVLRHAGVLRIDMGGAGQIAAARAVLDEVSGRFGGPASPWYFPDPDEYRDLLVRAGFSVQRARLVRQRRPFAAPSDVEGWLRSQVLPAYLPAIGAELRRAFASACVAEGIARLRRADGSYDQDYVRLDVLARRPAAPSRG